LRYDGGNAKPKKLKKLKSVSRAMWGYFCMLAFLLILLVELVFYVTVAINLENEARGKVEAVCFDMGRLLKFNPVKFEDGLIEARQDGVNVYLIAGDGRVFFPRDYKGTPDVYKEVMNRIGDEKDGYSLTYRTGNKVSCALKVDDGLQPFYILAKYSVTIVTRTVGTLQLYLLIIGVSIFLLAFLISYIFSKNITEGVQTLSDTAVKFANGSYDVEFVNVDYKELAALSDTLNYVRDEVKKSEDFQREILANVTHDLKTPLTMIKAYASMIKEISGDDREKREKHLQVIIDEADRLTGLVNDVLSVSKLQANIAEFNLKVFNLTELVYGIVNKFGYLQESQGYNFMIDIDPDLYTRADEEKINQVLYNLLGNAANYTGADKTVYISLKSSMDGKRVKFSVRDTGKGIEKDKIAEIWNRYYRVKENHNRPVKGTGLGLSIVKAILENHNFDFGVESEVGKGSTFWVDFPLVPSEI